MPGSGHHVSRGQEARENIVCCTEHMTDLSQARDEAAGRDSTWAGFREAGPGVGFLCKRVSEGVLLGELVREAREGKGAR